MSFLTKKCKDTLPSRNKNQSIPFKTALHAWSSTKWC